MKTPLRTCDLIPISEGVNQLLHAYRLENKFNQALVLVKWDEMVGIQVIKRTEKIFFKETTMFVQINSASLRHYLYGQKNEILKKLNTMLPSPLVQEIVFL